MKVYFIMWLDNRYHETFYIKDNAIAFARRLRDEFFIPCRILTNGLKEISF